MNKSAAHDVAKILARILLALDHGQEVAVIGGDAEALRGAGFEILPCPIAGVVRARRPYAAPA